MAYTQVQFAGYSIDTAPEANRDGTETYLGLPVAALDIDARCQLLQRAINTAAQNLPQASPPNGDTLTVFMIPEFYFRGVTGAYEMDDVQLAIAQLQTIAGDPRWADWVFAFGTIVGQSRSDDPTAPVEAYNFSLIQQGGAVNKGPDGARVVLKELQSSIDFVADASNPAGMLVGADVNYLGAGPTGPGREQQQVAYDGAGVFPLRGITWAMDICLDHGEGRLMQSPQLPGDAEVQIQLVPSCGMSIDPANVIAEMGGLVFNVDGNNGSHADLQQVALPFVQIAPSGAYPVSDADIVLTAISPPLTVQIDELYRYGAGEVVLFPAQPIPAARTVAGTTNTLVWPASKDYTFSFDLIYDLAGDLVTVLCRISSSKTNFHGNRYFLPLSLTTTDVNRQTVSIRVVEISGSGGFDRAVRCEIAVPGFAFQGVAFEFSSTLTGPPPETAW